MKGRFDIHQQGTAMYQELIRLIGPRQAKRVSASYDTPSALISAIRERHYPASDKAMTQLSNALEFCEAMLIAGASSARVELTSPGAVRDYLKLHLGGRTEEVFTVMYLDNQNKLIAAEDLFYGSLSQTAVYPRVVVRKALAHNAGAVVLAHNHPSNLACESQADRALTDALRAALSHLEVRVLDHLIVTDTDILSFAEKGLI